MSEIQSRAFTTSQKPAWSKEKIAKFLKEVAGSCEVYAITHDKDTDDEGQIIASHTHFVLLYDTPRKISTVARLFDTEINFVEQVKSTKAILRYLTHLDDSDKFQYDPKEVITNSKISYDITIMGNSLSDKEIAHMIHEGRGMELMGVVSVNKLRTIQAFLQYDRSGKIHAEIKAMADVVMRIDEHLTYAAKEVATMMKLMPDMTDKIAKGFMTIANEIAKARTISHKR